MKKTKIKVGTATQKAIVQTEYNRKQFEDNVLVIDSDEEKRIGWDGYIKFRLRTIDSSKDEYIYKMLLMFFDFDWIPTEHQATLEANMIETIEHNRKEYKLYYEDKNDGDELKKPIQFAEILLYFAERIGYEYQRSLAGCIEMILIENTLFRHGRPIKDSNPMVMPIKLIENILMSNEKENCVGLFGGLQQIPMSYTQQYQVYLSYALS